MHLAVAAWLLDTGVSGANRRLLATLQALPSMLQTGERITVLHNLDKAPSANLANLQWQKVGIPSGNLWQRRKAQAQILPGLLRELQADLLEQGCLPLTRKLPCPVSLTLHDLRDLGPYARRNRWLSRMALRMQCKLAKGIVVPSQFTHGELQQALGMRMPRTAVIPGGVDLQHFQAADTKATDTPYFLHVGHLEPRKNLSMLLQAFAQYLQQTKVTQTRLLLAGADAGEGNKLRQLAKELQLEDRVQFLGAVDEQQLQGLYANCLALCFPSLYEGYGLPALEAMAMGKCVLASKADALPEVVQDKGLLLDGSDPRIWALAMLDTSQNWGAMQAAAAHKHAEEWSWQRCAAASLKFWRQLAGDNWQKARQW